MRLIVAAAALVLLVATAEDALLEEEEEEAPLLERERRQINFGGGGGRNRNRNRDRNSNDGGGDRNGDDADNFGSLADLLGDDVAGDLGEDGIGVRLNGGASTRRQGRQCVDPRGRDGVCSFIFEDRCRPVLDRIRR